MLLISGAPRRAEGLGQDLLPHTRLVVLGFLLDHQFALPIARAHIDFGKKCRGAFFRQSGK